MIKAVLFDIDNTLIDFMKMKHGSCEAAVDAMIGAGLKIDKKAALELLYKLYDEYGIEYQHIFQKFTQKIGGTIDYRTIAYGIVAYRKVRESHLVPYGKVIPALIKLSKKYKLAVVTDAPVMQAWLRLVTTRLDNFFDVVVTKGEVRKEKTHAAPFKAALRRLGIKADEAVMIGDRIARDVETAKKLGIKTIYARYGDSKPPEKGKSGADAEIEDIGEIVSVIEQMN